jgi:hypothetical protein
LGARIEPFQDLQITLKVRLDVKENFKIALHLVYEDDLGKTETSEIESTIINIA